MLPPLFCEGTMQIIYQGTDITGYVDVMEAVHRDYASGRCDCLDLMLDHAKTWHRWGPCLDDTIELRIGGYTTGTLYLDTVEPEDGKYRILATALRSDARRRAWVSHENRSVGELFDICSAEAKMGSRLYGVDEGLRYPYLIRQNESCAAFLGRLMRMEGAALKTYSGRYTAISITKAQENPAGETLRLSANQRGVNYRNRSSLKVQSLTVQTPYARASASDAAVKTGESMTVCDAPAMDEATAGRWARGLLLWHNRQAEALEMETELDIAMTAMSRIDIESASIMRGEWIVDEVKHDFIRKRSSARLLRCIGTIA